MLRSGETVAQIRETDAGIAIENQLAASERAGLEVLNNAKIDDTIRADRNNEGGEPNSGIDIFRTKFQLKNSYKLRLPGDFDDEYNTREVFSLRRKAQIEQEGEV